MLKNPLFHTIISPIVFGVGVFLLYYLMGEGAPHLWTDIIAIFLVAYFCFIRFYPRVKSRKDKQNEIQESKLQGKRIIRVKGLNHQQRLAFMEQYKELYEDERSKTWIPVMIENGENMYLTYPPILCFSDFRILASLYVMDYAEIQDPNCEITAWYTIENASAEKQEVPFQNCNLMLTFGKNDKGNQDTYIVTEYGRIYVMHRLSNIITEVKDIDLKYEIIEDSEFIEK